MVKKIVVVRYTILVCALSLWDVTPSMGQTFGRVGEIEARGTAYHVYARPGDATVQILVMGLAGGIYEVTDGTRLDELLALVGGAAGPEIGVQTPTVTRQTTVRLYRGSEGNRSLIYAAPLEQVLLEPHEHPRLLDGDLFLIETVTRNKFSWRDIISVIGGAASLALLVERLSRRF